MPALPMVVPGSHGHKPQRNDFQPSQKHSKNPMNTDQKKLQMLAARGFTQTLNLEQKKAFLRLFTGEIADINIGIATDYLKSQVEHQTDIETDISFSIEFALSGNDFANLTVSEITSKNWHLLETESKKKIIKRILDKSKECQDEDQKKHWTDFAKDLWTLNNKPILAYAQNVINAWNSYTPEIKNIERQMALNVLKRSKEHLTKNEAAILDKIVMLP